MKFYVDEIIFEYAESLQSKPKKIKNGIVADMLSEISKRAIKRVVEREGSVKI